MRFSTTRLKSNICTCFITSLLLTSLFILSTFFNLKVRDLKCSPISGIDEDLGLPSSTEDVEEVDVTGSPFELIQSFVKSLPFHKARVDGQQIVKIYDWVWSGEKWNDLKNPYAVCLSTQSSMDRIHWIQELSQHWNGPLSLAVYISSPEEWIGLNLVVHHFQRCSQPFRDYVSIHIAIPTQITNWELDWEKVSNQNISQFLQSFVSPDSCETHPKVVVRQIIELFPSEAKLMLKYPQNHLRNIAKTACGPHWVFSSDIDIIPVQNSWRILSNFVATDEAQSCKKCAFVIPTFELNENISYPGSKVELLKHYWNKTANPFHFKIFWHGHASTNYPKWAKIDLEEGPVKISYDVVINETRLYEPFYLSPNTIPNFSERFIGYGFTRNSQVQQSLSEGWQFKVLSPIFSIHWGLQFPKTLISPGNDLNIRRRQTNANSLIYKLFKKELDFRKMLTKESGRRKPSLSSSKPIIKTI